MGLMTTEAKGRLGRWWFALAALVLALAAMPAGAATGCRALTLGGEVAADQTWQTAIGEGWQLRLVPIGPPTAGFSGWDVVVDRLPATGYPDAALLATPPYGSMNEREIGTSFGLRAQDALGWSTRSFRFLTRPVDFAAARALYLELERSGALSGRQSVGHQPNRAQQQAIARLAAFSAGAASGQLRILDARLVPGVGDAAAFAENWALAYARTAHEVEQAAPGQTSARGQLRRLRFAVTLWLPAGWRTPPGIPAPAANCPE